MEDRKQITLRIDEELCEALKKISYETGMTLTNVILLSIWNSILRL